MTRDPSGIDGALERARRHLLSLQREDGHWCGELEADSVLESEYVMLLHFLGRSDSEDARAAAREIRRQQRPEGAWAIYPGGPDDPSASVKAYLVLKLVGDDPDAPHMARARRVIRELGGLEAVNTYTRIYLALLGEYPWERCPAIPPEMVLLPRGFWFNLSEISSWSRGIFVPLAILWAHRPRRPVPPHARLDELRAGGGPGAGDRRGTRRGPGAAGRSGVLSRDLPGDPRVDPSRNAFERRWRRFFTTADRVLKGVERSGLTPFRRRALRAAEEWILARQARTDGLGAIFPAVLNAIMALRCQGYAEDHPVVRHELAGLEKMILREEGTLRIQPSLSPVWDTAQALEALRSAGLPGDDPAYLQGARWLLDHEVRHPGDWRDRVEGVEPAGWYFQYANEFYPDCDDTAEVLQALRHARTEDPELALALEAARARGLAWLLAMQNDDGGWAAFDRGCGEKEALTCVPFADHNAMLDPSCADITGRVLALLADEGLAPTHPAVRRGVEYLRGEQLPDGTWYGRWGCNYLYGTWLALWGLRASGEELGAGRYRRAVDWLLEVQNEDGGWGETLGSYADPDLKGQGPSTAAQTAWALLALRAAGEGDSEAASRGLAYLLHNQQPDGGWDDPWWTGTGFPEVFYLRYHYYDDYFPLLALAEYAGGSERSGLRERPGSWADPETEEAGSHSVTRQAGL